MCLKSMVMVVVKENPLNVVHLYKPAYDITALNINVPLSRHANGADGLETRMSLTGTQLKSEQPQNDWFNDWLQHAFARSCLPYVECASPYMWQVLLIGSGALIRSQTPCYSRTAFRSGSETKKCFILEWSIKRRPIKFTHTSLCTCNACFKTKGND